MIRKDKQAFSLVELSIVLVILGLITGAVLVGTSMVRAAQLRNVVTQTERFINAAKIFRDQYGALPGDITNAQGYWGVAHAVAATCITTSSSTAVTCNGDGNGMIDVSTGSNERYRFWQHLANAGLIEGQFTGISASGNTFTSTATNSPAGKINASLWYAANWLSLSGDGNRFDGAYNNVLEFGGIVATNEPANVVFSPTELGSIDKKTDDGKPAQGKLVMRGVFASCTNGANSAALTADYLLSSDNNQPACAAVWTNAF
ncbi:MAG: type II secretion system protein [Rickettsiales bacterium]